LGYSRPSLRDEEGQILAALDKNVRAPIKCEMQAARLSPRRDEKTIASKR
jgi:hypothetical protein